MNPKSPIFTLVKFLLLALIAFLLVMVWWSSNLIEKGLIQLNRQVERLESKVGREVVRESAPRLQKKSSFDNPLIDKSLPNLLEIDPFYATTLPDLLGENFRFSPLWRTASISKPQNLGIFNGFADVSAWHSLCGVSVGTQKFGTYESYAPEFAYRMEERVRKDGKGTEFWLFLRDDIFWNPLNPRHFPSSIKLAPHFLQEWRVTAHDIQLYWYTIMNPFNQETGAVALKQYFRDIEEIEVIDDLTLVVRWKTKEFTLPDGKEVYRNKYIAKKWTLALSPIPSFVYLYYPDGTKIVPGDEDRSVYLENSTYGQAFAQHWAKNTIVSCGPYLFEGMNDEGIRFSKNENYFAPLRVLNLELDNGFRASPTSIWTDFQEGKLPTHTLRAQELSEWERFRDSPIYQQQKENGEAIFEINYLGRMFGYIGWNEKNPLFKSAKVRRALTLAIDRQRIVSQILNGEAIETTGTFAPNSPHKDPDLTPWPYDPQEARELLAEEGFTDRSGRGILEKEIDGDWIPFRFTVNYYVNNETYKAIASYLVTALKEVGIQVDTYGLDVADLTAKMDDKDFDAMMMFWTFGTPPEDPRQLWHSKLADEKGSSNIISFQNSEVDQIIDQLDYEDDPSARKELYWRFCQVLHEEQPYTFLFVPKQRLLYREYVQNVFIPADRQDLIPGANVEEPQSSAFWIKKTR